MATQAQRGVQVTSLCFPDSGHCEHLRQHPLLYRERVQGFVAGCLSTKDSKTLGSSFAVST
jgi:hypothetical protein